MPVVASIIIKRLLQLGKPLNRSKRINVKLMEKDFADRKVIRGSHEKPLPLLLTKYTSTPPPTPITDIF